MDCAETQLMLSDYLSKMQWLRIRFQLRIIHVAASKAYKDATAFCEKTQESSCLARQSPQKPSSHITFLLTISISDSIITTFQTALTTIITKDHTHLILTVEHHSCVLVLALKAIQERGPWIVTSSLSLNANHGRTTLLHINAFQCNNGSFVWCASAIGVDRRTLSLRKYRSPIILTCT